MKLYYIFKIEDGVRLYFNMSKWTWIDKPTMNCMSFKEQSMKNKLEKIGEGTLVCVFIP